MKIEMDSTAADAACNISLIIAAVAATAILTFGIGGCVRDVNKTRVAAGLVEKPMVSQSSTIWTKP